MLAIRKVVEGGLLLAKYEQGCGPSPNPVWSLPSSCRQKRELLEDSEARLRDTWQKGFYHRCMKKGINLGSWQLVTSYTKEFSLRKDTTGIYCNVWGQKRLARYSRKYMQENTENTREGRSYTDAYCRWATIGPL